jgi:hypothetical protein
MMLRSSKSDLDLKRYWELVDGTAETPDLPAQLVN